MNYKLAFALGLIAPGTVGREPVAYLYNGVRLPGLPETELPYAVIVYGEQYVLGVGTVKQYSLLFTSEPLTWIVGSAAPLTSNGISVSLDRFSMGVDESEWTHLSDYPTEGTINFQCDTAIWSNIDMADADGNIHLNASAPIPVYE